LGEHGEPNHGYGLYDATLRVPWVLAGPGVPAGREVAALAGAADVAPTLLALTGLPPLGFAQGRDLSSFDEAADDSEHGVYGETLATYYDHGWSPLYTRRTHAQRFVRAPRPELYTSVSDPAETDNRLAGEEASTWDQAVRNHETALDAVLAETGSAQTREIDPATQSALHALGYAVPARAALPGEMVSEIDPKDGLAALGWYLAASQSFGAGRAEEALGFAERAQPAMPRSPDLASLLARIHLSRHRADLALPHAERASELLPGKALHHALLGDSLMGTGRLRDAVVAYGRALERDEGMAPAHTGAMWRSLLDGTPDAALHHGARALELEPDDEDIALRVAQVYEHLGERQRAAQVLRGYLSRTARPSPRAYMDLAIQQAALGLDPARELARAGSAADDPQRRLRLGRAYAQAGRVEAARGVLRELVRDVPGLEAARHELEGLGRLDASGAQGTLGRGEGAWIPGVDSNHDS
ncbi:MAG: tetratricopeptide repeat protein, partial [Proteobacteria bacterium]|nr:tetratricopeptide repeat protein [Pseudomonadota bacterium]